MMTLMYASLMMYLICLLSSGIYYYVYGGSCIYGCWLCI